MSKVSEALKLVDRGIAVFPCDPTPDPNKDNKPKKTPLTKHGFKDSTADPAQIREWWREYPDALIGVPTGDRFVVIDCDLHHRRALGWYFDHAVRLITRKHTTGSGGTHLLFRPHAGFGTISAGKIAPHIDTRGIGGYIIWWPAEGLEVLHGNVLAEVPDWIIRKLETPKAAEYVPRPITVTSVCRSIEGIIRMIATATPGERNGKLFWGANRLKDAADQSIISHSDAMGLALEAATRCGLPYVEARKTVASAFRNR
jgi:hypothetical protein